MIKSFTDLEVWRTDHELVIQIYQITKVFPKEELFGLVSQMNRYSASIVANFAEGLGRQYFKQKEQSYFISTGSLFELKGQHLITKDVAYVSKADFIKLAELANKCLAQLNTMLRAHRNNRYSKFENRDSK